MDGIAAFGCTPQVGIDLASGNRAEIANQTKAFVRYSLLPILPPSATTISIDGMDGTGKTTLGRALATELDAAFFDLDDFLDTRKNRYFSALQFKTLSASVESELRVILAGCLMNAVLRQIEHPADFRIYVVRTARMRSQPGIEWVDERDILLDDRPAEDLITELEDRTRRWAHAPPPIGGGDSNVPELAKELIRYHREFVPHKTANLIIRLARVDS
jgi:hypothetical protein